MTYYGMGEGSLWLRSWRVDRGREKQEALPGWARGAGQKDKVGEQVGRTGLSGPWGGILAREFGVNAIP